MVALPTSMMKIKILKISVIRQWLTSHLSGSHQKKKIDIFDKYSFLENDKTRIKEMLEKHLSYTNSPKAKKILEEFKKEISNFVKVLPIDFKNAIQKSKN